MAGSTAESMADHHACRLWTRTWSLRIFHDCTNTIESRDTMVGNSLGTDILGTNSWLQVISIPSYRRIASHRISNSHSRLNRAKDAASGDRHDRLFYAFRSMAYRPHSNRHTTIRSRRDCCHL